MSVDSVTLDPLATAEGSTEDLELSKFNEDGEVRVVLTI